MNKQIKDRAYIHFYNISILLARQVSRIWAFNQLYVLTGHITADKKEVLRSL